MEASVPSSLEAKLTGIKFALTTPEEICKASISDCPISHASQLSNPFLGLPLDAGKCESCGTGEPGQCEGHFGYVELPTPIYHPDHVGELKRMLSLVCLKCLKLKNRKSQVKNIGVMEQVLASCCEETIQVSINEAKTTDGACYLELKVPSRSKREEPWNFLEKYGFRYRHISKNSRPLLPAEVISMLKKMPQDTRKKLRGKGYFPQEGYIIQYLPVPPNCLSVPDVSDGISTMSTDHSIALLKKVLRQVEIIKSSRSGKPNFESHEIEACDLQAAVVQYLQFRGTNKASRDMDTRFGVNKDVNTPSTKAWLEKMKTLFIRKGSGFSSRSVITGDPYKGVAAIGLPEEIAKKITFEERVNQHNIGFLQKLVDDNLCLTYKDGTSSYSLREGAKGHTYLKLGQVVNRRIVDGDIVFINRPPTTHKHSLQALSVYIHKDHTAKINPLICGPLSADFDGDCIHLFYPQSLEAKAEVVELFSVEKQLLSSHTGNFNLQLATDALLSLKTIFKKFFLTRAAAQQLAMFVPNMLPKPAVIKGGSGALWTASQILEMTLPSSFNYSGERHQISKSEVVRLDYSREVMGSIMNDIVTSLFFLEGPKEVLKFFDALQPLLMENLYSEGFSVSLRDFFVPEDVLETTHKEIKKVSPLLSHLHVAYSESIAVHLENSLSSVKDLIKGFVVNSAIGNLIDSKSESALSKVIQQMGFLGFQLSSREKFYSETLLNDVSAMFQRNHPSSDDHPTEEFGFVSRPLFRGLNPYQAMIHGISSRAIMVRSSRGLTEPGTLFKNLMAILRDVVMSYDGTVRNMCSNSILQFEYGVNTSNVSSEFCAGDPVGVLAATAMSNPAYKAVLDSSPSSSSSWEMMKDILLCRASFKNDISDRRVLLYLKNCDCGRKHCHENAALLVKNQLTRIILKDTAVDFSIEYRSQLLHEANETSPGLVGHIHLNKEKLLQANISMKEILGKCEETIILHQKKKKVGVLFKRIDLSHSDCCSFESDWTGMPCIQFMWQTSGDGLLEKASQFLVDTVWPTLLQTVIKGDSRVSTANIVCVGRDTATWVKSPCRSSKEELAVDVVLEKTAVNKSGDAWRVVIDSCLPVFDLIDTQRSIPHGIKQVEEVLGISCAFEMAVQRLSTSVTMVTKGVLKDHLLLLGNTMTCTGSLIGFNAGGIKSLSKTMNIQVPFMNATLFTPRKHFERSAEKCQNDNLSSVVASCVWGKHVSVGTGSPFEILWDTRKAELNPEKEIDVYNFLHLVNGSSNLKDTGTSCLGADVEDLSPEEDFLEFDLSPARESGADKPTFEDEVEFRINGVDNVGVMKEDSWSGWDKKVDSEDNDWTKKAGKSTRAEEASKSSAWEKKVDSDGGDWMNNQQNWGRSSSQEPKDGSSHAEGFTEKGWGEKDNQGESPVNNWNSTQRKATESTAAQVWGKSSHIQKQKESSVDSWDSSKQSKDSSLAQGWGSNGTESKMSNTWGSQNEWTDPESRNLTTPKESPASNWGVYSRAEGSTEKGWGEKDDQKESSVNTWNSSHRKTNESTDAQGWGVSSNELKQKEPLVDSWDSSKQSEDLPAAQGWGSNMTEPKTPNTWGSQNPTTPKESCAADNWSSGKKQSDDSNIDQGWGSKDNSWGAKDTDSKPSSNAWGSSSDWAKSGSQSPRGQNDSPIDNWGSDQKQSSNSTFSKGWGSEDKDGQPQWGRGRGRGRGRSWGRGGGRDGSQGRGNSGGEWKSKRPPRPDDGNALGLFTITRQRLEVFTAEEQDVLTEVEAVMKSVRRVMNLKDYNNGDPLAEDDQRFIIDNVFNYHPDKAMKMGAGVDYIMVNKHKEFQESRCFYAVSTNGGQEDFSYRKCLENFIRQKYPDVAESFIGKYFKRPQPRSGWNNRDRGGSMPTRGEPGNSGWSSSPVPEDSRTPDWDHQASTPNDTYSQSRKKDVTDETAATPNP